MGLFSKDKKEEVMVVNDANAEEFSIPVYFNGDPIGEVIRIRGKEVGGIDLLEMWLKLGLGSGIEPMILEVIKKQGIHLGSNVQVKEQP